METFQEFFMWTVLWLLAANTFVLGWYAWNHQRGGYDKVFSVIFYLLGAAISSTIIYVAITGQY